MNNSKKIIELKNLVEGAEISLQQARKILDNLAGNQEKISLNSEAKTSGSISSDEKGQIIEGIFDGQNMVGPDGKKYSVPANYASKSKLVEGDGLKLTITPDGSFVYKQVNPLERDRLNGKLIIDDETGDYKVLAQGKSYKILTASVTYFKGEPGNNATILIPKGKDTTWAAVENIFDVADTPVETAESEIEPIQPSEEHNTTVAETAQSNDLTAEEPAENKPLPDITSSNHINPSENSNSNLNSNQEEFLSPDNQDNTTPEHSDQDKNITEDKNQESVLDKYDRDSAEVEHQVEANNQPQDIFSASNKTNTDDVDLRPKPEIDTTPSPSNNNMGDNNIDDLDKKDYQGLEEI